MRNSPKSPAVASAEMESVELEMEMPPLDVKIRPSISSSASLAASGESNTVKQQDGSAGLRPEIEVLILHECRGTPY